MPEIQYLAYLHNAEDQLRGEAATMQFFSAGAYRNPLVVRIAGLAYQQGFGGHFHNDNAVAVLRDIPGLVVAVPARAEDAGPMLRTCLAAALVDGSVCVFLEPIALYHTRDLYEDGDGLWLGEYDPPAEWTDRHVPIGRARVYSGGGESDDVTIITFGNGVRLSLRAAARLADEGVGCRVARPALAGAAAGGGHHPRVGRDRAGAGRRRDPALGRRRRGRDRRPGRRRVRRGGPAGRRGGLVHPARAGGAARPGLRGADRRRVSGPCWRDNLHIQTPCHLRGLAVLCGLPLTGGDWRGYCLRA